MDSYKLEQHVETFAPFATEKLPDGIWKRLYDSALGSLTGVLVGRLGFRLYAEIVELQAQVAELRAQVAELQKERERV
ncbi:MAG TPA: hypothetical protein VFN26_11600 [Candidatus Acidoferrum sp.]|nr:hypothetical protein [Candidatus Acidoferrum sp.]